MTAQAAAEGVPKDEFQPGGGPFERGVIKAFIAIPFTALIIGVPLGLIFGFVWWQDILLYLVFYHLTVTGIGVGNHRGFTHGSYKFKKRWLKISLAIAGSLAIEGSVVRWVADHRKHHKFSDRDGDPHSPWRYGPKFRDLTKGFIYAHIGWLFDPEQTIIRPKAKAYAPDMINDKDTRRISKQFPLWVGVTLVSPALLGALMHWSWWGLLSGFFWGGLVRIAMMHHVTFSINSICHMTGEKPFKTGDKSGNVWWLAILSQGESWHNLHHSDPTCARHGVDKHQWDINARIIWFFEKLGWVYDVRWPVKERLDARRIQPAA